MPLSSVHVDGFDFLIFGTDWTAFWRPGALPYAPALPRRIFDVTRVALAGQRLSLWNTPILHGGIAHAFFSVKAGTMAWLTPPMLTRSCTLKAAARRAQAARGRSGQSAAQRAVQAAVKPARLHYDPEQVRHVAPGLRRPTAQGRPPEP